MLTATLVTKNPETEPAWVSISRWRNEENVEHEHNRILFNHKEKGDGKSAAKWIQLEIFMLSERSQIREDSVCFLQTQTLVLKSVCVCVPPHAHC